MGANPKVVGFPPKMDGLFHGSNPMNKWMIWGLKTSIFGNTHIVPERNISQEMNIDNNLIDTGDKQAAREVFHSFFK